MTKILAGVSLVLAMVSAAAAGYAVLEMRSLRTQLVERQLLPPRRATDDLVLLDDGAEELPPAPAAMATRLREMEKQLDEVSDRVTAQHEQNSAAVAGVRDELQTTVRRVEAAMVKAGRQPGAVVPAPSAAAPDDERIKKMIKSQVEEEVKKRQSKDQEKPPLSQVAATLGLDEWQREQMRREVVRGQKETIELLSTPTEDGTIMLDELINAFIGMQGRSPEEAQAHMMKIYGRLSTETVPGTEETYAQRITAVHQSVSDGLQRNLSQEQWNEYEKMGISDPTQIQVKGGPWERAFQEFTKRQKKK